MTYTGINETYVGQKPGLTKTKTMLTPGVYETRTAKLFPQYSGWNDQVAVEETYKIAVTVPEKWIDEPTPVAAHQTTACRKRWARVRAHRCDCSPCSAVGEEAQGHFPQSLP